MLTFLLDEYKEKVLKDYHLRLWALHFGLFTLVLLSGAALAVPQFAILQSKRDAVLLEKSASSSAATGETEAIKDEVRAIKEKLLVIKESSGKEPIALVLERALAKKGSGIVITSINLVRGGTPGAITLSGIASSRDALVAFSKRLQAEPAFSNATLPVSSLAKNKDIPFSIAIDSKF